MRTFKILFYVRRTGDQDWKTEFVYLTAETANDALEEWKDSVPSWKEVKLRSIMSKGGL